MFIIKDLTGKVPFRHRTNDVETAADIVMGITGGEIDYKNVLQVAGTMHFGDVFISKTQDSMYSVECVTDEEAEEAYNDD